MIAYRKNKLIHLICFSTFALFAGLIIFRAEIFSLLLDRNEVTVNRKAVLKEDDLIVSQLLNEPQEKVSLKYLTINGKMFSTSLDSEKKQSAWQHFSHRDWLGRPQKAEANLNKKMMPTMPREKLNIKTPGYKIYQDHDHQYLYHRSHLIGYQLTGENNNPKNLVTGTRQMNATTENNPELSMESFENKVAVYLKNNPTDFVHYEVVPQYRNVERIPRGIIIKALSNKPNGIAQHVFIPNTQHGWKINYFNGNAVQEN